MEPTMVSGRDPGAMQWKMVVFSGRWRMVASRSNYHSEMGEWPNCEGQVPHPRKASAPEAKTGPRPGPKG